MTWVAPRTWVTGETLTSTLLNTHVRDNFLTMAGAIGTAYAPAAANTDLAQPTNWMHPIAPTAGGWSIRSIAAAPQAGQRLVLRNTATFALSLLHATAGGTGAQLNLRGAASFALAQFEAIELIYDGTTWNEIGRDAAAGAEMAYAQIVSSVNITATTEGTANTVLTLPATTFDGATKVKLEFFDPRWQTPGSAAEMVAVLYDGAASVGLLGYGVNAGAGAAGKFEYIFTPAAATKTYSIRGYVSAGTGIAIAGAGGSGLNMPAWARIARTA